MLLSKHLSLFEETWLNVRRRIAGVDLVKRRLYEACQRVIKNNRDLSMGSIFFGEYIEDPLGPLRDPKTNKRYRYENTAVAVDWLWEELAAMSFTGKWHLKNIDGNTYGAMSRIMFGRFRHNDLQPYHETRSPVLNRLVALSMGLDEYHFSQMNRLQYTLLKIHGKDTLKAANRMRLINRANLFHTRFVLDYQEDGYVPLGLIMFVSSNPSLNPEQFVEPGEYLSEIFYHNFIESKNLNLQIQKLNVLFDQIVNKASVADIAVFDQNFKYRFLNEGSISDPQLREWMVGRDDLDYCRYKNRPLEIAINRQNGMRRAIVERKSQRVYETIVTPLGEKKYYERIFNPYYDSDGNFVHLIGYGLDITERTRYEQTIQYQATHDSLTGLLNRESLKKCIKDEIALAEKTPQHGFAVLFIDLDGFKYINDHLGHVSGDQLLRDLALRLQKHQDNLGCFYRIGGDEFSLVISDFKSRANLNRAADLIVEIVRQPFILMGGNYTVTASVGIALYGQDGTTEDELLKNADAAMYAIKGKSKNSYGFYNPSLKKDNEMRLRLQNEMYVAIAERQFVNYYQDQIDAVTEKVVAREVLVRWQHPTRGLITPNHFIGLAEETHQILEIGRLVLLEACHQAVAWHKEGNPWVRMAVNVSPIQFEQGDFFELVSKTLEKTKMPPEYLELEITEESATKNIEHTTKLLTQLSKLGVKISIDDFGMGNSALKYLENFPANSLKIDRSFINEMGSNPKKAGLVELILGIAKNFKLVAVAEGVEDSNQLEWLKERGCDLIQGFYYSKPRPADQVVHR